jgi:predicted AAA+ superfamily ATPase
MFNLSNDGFPICKIVGDSKLKNKIVSMSENEDDEYIRYVKEIQLEGENKFELLPNTKADRDVIYYSGPAGSGKSYLMASYLRNYKKEFKDRQIYLFSEKESDEVLDKIKDIKRVKMDEQLITDPLDLKDFNEEACCVVFDDIDSLEKKLKVAVYTLLNKLLKVGRSYKISVLVSSHSSCDGALTKSMLNESSVICFYPTTYSRTIKYLAENYIGMGKKDIAKMRKNKSRYCYYIKAYPSAILQERNIWRMGQDE